jgi:hypothetical protein
VALLSWVSSASGAPIVIDGSTTDRTGISYPRMVADFDDDEQTGDTESDIVGNSLRAALYIQFDDWGTPGVLTDEDIAFRIRVGAVSDPVTPTGVMVPQPSSLALVLFEILGLAARRARSSPRV